MPQILLAVIALIIVIVLSERLRKFLMHRHLWRLMRFFLVTTLVVLFCGMIGTWGWYYWKEQLAHQPVTNWQDKTIRLDTDPVTPFAGEKSNQNN